MRTNQTYLNNDKDSGLETWTKHKYFSSSDIKSCCRTWADKERLCFIPGDGTFYLRAVKLEHVTSEVFLWISDVSCAQFVFRQFKFTHFYNLLKSELHCPVQLPHHSSQMSTQKASTHLKTLELIHQKKNTEFKCLCLFIFKTVIICKIIKKKHKLQNFYNLNSIKWRDCRIWRKHKWALKCS